ncbi:hypothetical protein K4F85_04140 [Phaeobacter inhibens]|uniref:hypothetical protein n=1 Tax=Phaeobacter inhibens TaxID=221822 RepID=UPI0021A65DB3|nr:hypothetical protein [Phaeobacter inhibens]UWR42088.1 hypothetical protein K4F85_04140 [Phaeobacter inhibens]
MTKENGEQSQGGIGPSEARDLRNELFDLVCTGRVSTVEGQERLRAILIILGADAESDEQNYSGQMEVRTEPFSDEEIWNNTPPCFRSMLGPKFKKRFEQ